MIFIESALSSPTVKSLKRGSQDWRNKKDAEPLTERA